jgi:hypothetical protein
LLVEDVPDVLTTLFRVDADIYSDQPPSIGCRPLIDQPWSHTLDPYKLSGFTGGYTIKTDREIERALQIALIRHTVLWHGKLHKGFSGS